MKLPPDHVARTAEVPMNGLRNARMLVPALVGEPCDAYHDSVVWVASCGWNDPPLMLQRVRGLLALVTSARTGLAAPWSLITASCAAGVPAQLARSAAHAGTATGLGSTIGVGEGLGVGLSSGLGLGLGEGDDCEGVVLAAGVSGPLGVQAASAQTARRRTTPYLTGGCNEQRCGEVTRVPGRRKSPRIPLDRQAWG